MLLSLLITIIFVTLFPIFCLTCVNTDWICYKNVPWWCSSTRVTFGFAKKELNYSFFAYFHFTQTFGGSAKTRKTSYPLNFTTPLLKLLALSFRGFPREFFDISDHTAHRRIFSQLWGSLLWDATKITCIRLMYPGRCFQRRYIQIITENAVRKK